MAFTKTPVNSTYQTKPLQLLAELNSRSSTADKDAITINTYAEVIRNKEIGDRELTINKRWGSTEFISSVGSGGVRGCYYWKDNNAIYLAILSNVYVYNASSGALLSTLTSVFGTTTGEVGFTEFEYDTGTTKLVVTDGTTLSTIDTAYTVVACVDADLPQHIPRPIYLDGYLFVLKINTADLYNSNNNDPLLWTAGDFITAEMLPDTALIPIKLNNYLVVAGSKSIEYFWDAAIASGSPLQRNDTPIKFTGYIGALAKWGNQAVFVGSKEEASPDVFILDDFKITPISTEAIRRHLTSIDLSAIYGNIISIDGHDLYVLHTGTSSYVYDMETKLWDKWAYQTNLYFNIKWTMNIRTSTTYKSLFILDSSQAVYRFDSSLYQDSGTSFTVTVITPNHEFDSYNRKTMSALTIYSDKPTSSSSVLVQWSDNDYTSYNTGLSVDLYQEHPRITRLGGFRRRAFKFTHTANLPLQIRRVDVDINLGNS